MTNSIRPIQRSRLSIAAVVIATICGLGASRAAEDAPAPIEIRAAWLTLDAISADAARGAEEIHSLVDRLADARFNTIFVWVRSEYAVAIEEERYRQQAPTAAWDAVGELLRAAEQRGLQVHMWYSFTHYKTPNSPEFDPACDGDPQWASVALDELNSDRRSMLDVCPLHPAGRRWELALIQRFVSRYPSLAGVHIEEPGYGYADRCVCDHCRQVFREINDAALEAELTSERAADLKCLGTTDFMRDLQHWIRASDRKLVLSANGGFDGQAERIQGRDWARWARLGWLDFYAAQVYVSDQENFNRRVAVVTGDLREQCPVLIGIGVNWSSGANDAATVVRQVELARQAGAQGVVLYHAAAFSDELLEALKAGPFHAPAPAVQSP
jgi:uncharacterized lipoprotein YddW (UPF0748 family)